MPIPVTLPSGSLVINDTVSATAEAFVAAIGQVFRSGTSGATFNTPPTLFPDGENPHIDPGTGKPYLRPLVISTPEEQLFFRQLAVAIISAIGSGGGGPPPTPTPQLVKFDAACLSSAAVGDLVRVSSPDHVAVANIASVATMPVVGVIVAKATTTSCTVQTHGLVQGLFSGLTAGEQYYADRTGRLGPIPVPTSGETLLWQSMGIALDSTSFILIPSLTMTRITG